MAREPQARLDIPGIDWDKIWEKVYGPQMWWHLKRIREARRRIKKLKKLLPNSAGPEETKAINDAIKSAEDAIKWDQKQIEKLQNPQAVP